MVVHTPRRVVLFCFPFHSSPLPNLGMQWSMARLAGYCYPRAEPQLAYSAGGGTFSIQNSSRMVSFRSASRATNWAWSVVRDVSMR